MPSNRPSLTVKLIGLFYSCDILQRHSKVIAGEINQVEKIAFDPLTAASVDHNAVQQLDMLLFE